MKLLVLALLVVICSTLANVSTAEARVQCYSVNMNWQRADHLTQALYRGVLQRQPDASGFDFWVNAFLTHPDCNGLATIAHDFSRSAEGQAKLRQVGAQSIARSIAVQFGTGNASELARRIARGDIAGVVYDALASANAR